MRKRAFRIFTAVFIPLFVLFIIFVSFFTAYRRPCRRLVEQSFSDPPLVFALIKAESGFSADAVSRAGAVGLMQLLPSTARFICEHEGIRFEAERLTEEEYNVTLGCLYLKYLSEKFGAEETVIAAYNAGEGVVGEWLENSLYSADGKRLSAIPYPETRDYVKKIIKFKKIYSFFD